MTGNSNDITIHGYPAADPTQTDSEATRKSASSDYATIRAALVDPGSYYVSDQCTYDMEPAKAALDRMADPTQSYSNDVRVEQSRETDSAIPTGGMKQADAVMDAMQEALDTLTTALRSAREERDDAQRESERLRGLLAAYGATLIANGRFRAAITKKDEALREIEPDKLDLLAGWFDVDDANKGKTGTDVQDDLRAWAKAVRRALAEPTEEG